MFLKIWVRFELLQRKHVSKILYSKSDFKDVWYTKRNLRQNIYFSKDVKISTYLTLLNTLYVESYLEYVAVGESLILYWKFQWKTPSIYISIQPLNQTENTGLISYVLRE